jgi:hypothetical protein
VKSHPQSRIEMQANILTVASVGIVVYVFANVLHELIGHGGACLLVGGRPILVSTVNMECSVENRLVEAAGTLMNATAGAFFLLLGRWMRRLSPVWRYFFWLSMTVSFFGAAGYLAFSGIAGFGDWAQVVQGLGARWMWRAGLAFAGVIGYIFAIRLSLVELCPLVGYDEPERRARARRLAQIPYFAGGTLACLAGMRNPQGMILVALSAAASTFGGASGLVWMHNLLRAARFRCGVLTPALIGRSPGWMATACILTVLFIAVLGPGVRLR